MKKRFLILAVLFLAPLPAFSVPMLVQHRTVQFCDGAVNCPITFSMSVTVGNLVTIPASVFAEIGGDNIGNFADNKGNSYTQWEFNNSASGFPVLSVGYSMPTTGGTSFTVTVSVASGTQNYFIVDAVEWSGIQASPLDKTAVNDNINGSDTSFNTGTTATTATANELVIAGVWLGTGNASSGLTSPASSGYQSLFVNQDGAARCCASEFSYKIISATGTQTASWMSSVAGGWGAIIITFNGTAGGGGTGKRVILGGGIL